MPYPMEDFKRYFKKNFIAELTTEERLEGLSAEERMRGLSAEELIKGLSVEERLRGLTTEQIQQALAAIDRSRKTSRRRPRTIDPEK